MNYCGNWTSELLKIAALGFFAFVRQWYRLDSSVFKNVHSFYQRCVVFSSWHPAFIPLGSRPVEIEAC